MSTPSFAFATGIRSARRAADGPHHPPKRKHPSVATLQGNQRSFASSVSLDSSGVPLRHDELSRNQNRTPSPFLLPNRDASQERQNVMQSWAAMRREPAPIEGLLFRYRRLVEALDPENANAPTRDVERLLLQVLLRCVLMDFTPARVDVSIEGGAIVQFVNGKTYADIELLNEGVVLASCSRPGVAPEVWALAGTEPKELSVTLDRLRAYIHGSY